MKAKDLFKKLGYGEIEVIDKERYINYVNCNEENTEFYFDLEEKTIEKHYLNSGISVPITLDELQAINQQCRELGWFDE